MTTARQADVIKEQVERNFPMAPQPLNFTKGTIAIRRDAKIGSKASQGRQALAIRPSLIEVNDKSLKATILASPWLAAGDPSG
jgi:hypothetical protein